MIPEGRWVGKRGFKHDMRKEVVRRVKCGPGTRQTARETKDEEKRDP
jgi:hypothetical protein